jgi:hypothetical protein
MRKRTVATKQLTLRGFDADLERALVKEARTSGLSLNQAAVKLLRRGAGLASGPAPNAVGNALDHLIGTWTADDAGRMAAASAVFERVDEDLWK